MSRIVLDTNCLIQSIPYKSRYHKVWISFVKGENTLCVSNEIIEEYAEVLHRLTDYETADYVVKTILRSCFEFLQKVFLGLMYPFSCVLWAIFWPFSLLFFVR